MHAEIYALHTSNVHRHLQLPVVDSFQKDAADMEATELPGRCPTLIPFFVLLYYIKKNIKKTMINGINESMNTRTLIHANA
jgi:hypothetical protein